MVEDMLELSLLYELMFCNIANYPIILNFRFFGIAKVPKVPDCRKSTVLVLYGSLKKADLKYCINVLV